MDTSATSNASNIKASELMGRMDKAYQQLQSFSAEFDSRSSDDPSKPVMHARLAFQREPERAIATITQPDPGAYVYDGANFFHYPAPDRTHFTMTANTWNNLAGSGIAVVFGRLVADPRQDLLSRMLTSGFQTQNDLGTMSQLNLLPQAVVDNQLCDRLQAVLDDGSRVLLVIGSRDHLLRRATWSRIDTDGKNRYFVEQYTDIRINPSISSTEFQFHPPAGVTLAETP